MTSAPVFEPRGCPTPGACSCPFVAPAPDDGKIVEAMLTAYLNAEDWSRTETMTDAFAVALQHLTRSTTMRSEAEMRAYGDQRAREALKQAAKFASDLWKPYTVAESYRAGQLDMALHISTGILSLIPEEPRP